MLSQSSFPDDKCNHFLPDHPFARYFFSPSAPIRAEKCLMLKTMVWWRQQYTIVFFFFEEMATSARPKDTVLIDPSIFHASSFSLSRLLCRAKSSLQGVTSHSQILMCRVYLQLPWAPLHFALLDLFAVPQNRSAIGFLQAARVRSLV